MAIKTIKKAESKDKEFILSTAIIGNQVKKNIDLLIKIKKELDLNISCSDHKEDSQELKEALFLINQAMDAKELSILISQICVKCCTFKLKNFDAIVQKKIQRDKEIAIIEKLEREV